MELETRMARVVKLVAALEDRPVLQVYLPLETVRGIALDAV